MTDRPIIFSAGMIRALLDGRKSQTRRVLKLPKKIHSGGPIYERPDMGGWEATTLGGRGCFRIGMGGERVPVSERPAIWNQTTGTCMALPYAPGDRLWVREAWCDTMQGPAYKATWGIEQQWRSPIHMPRWASRLTLIVTDVRVERIQDISEADAQAEGCHVYASSATIDCDTPDPRQEYRRLWNSLHGPDAWDANPWVAAIRFDVRRENIDAAAAPAKGGE